LVDYICFNIARLVGFSNGLLVEVAEDAVGIVQASLDQECGGRIGVVDDIGDLDERLGAVFVGRGYLSEVGNEVLEELAPGWDVLVNCEQLRKSPHTLEALC